MAGGRIQSSTASVTVLYLGWDNTLFIVPGGPWVPRGRTPWPKGEPLTGLSVEVKSAGDTAEDSGIGWGWPSTSAVAS